ncbi:MAG: synaptic vesicle rane protein [Blastocatellia bacterium]
MRQIVITRSGGIDVLKIEERPDPTPVKGEALIRVRAAGINFADILARQGLYPDAPRLPAVVGYEVAGMVEAVGPETETTLVGKAVLVLTRFGGYADLVTVPLGQVFEKPEALTFEQAAAIPVNYLTAYGLLVVMGSLHKGEAVLIQNAGGGVGLAALDIAKQIGAITYGTASTGKHKFLKARGLDHAIDYRGQDWLPELMRLTGGRGVELAMDPIGGKSWKKSYKALRSTGRLGVFGVSVGASEGLAGKLGMLKAAIQMPWFHPLALMGANKSVFGLNLGHLWHESQKIAEWMQVILDGVRRGWVQPYVDKSFSFEQAGAAHAYIEARRNIGKVVLVP